MPSKFEKSTIGKTLIAAVVMYNYFTWYPEGKICFMAPSRPLVMQQLEACTNIMGISEDETAMLEGSVSKKDRYLIWRQKRVFFCTPQTFMNDLHSNDATATDFVLLVFDEAHRAMGQYAYCQVIQAMDKASSPSRYRVLALSATPGADRKAVQDLIFNLHIEHIELRTEDDPEILKHTHHKQLEFVCTKGFGSFDDRILSSLLSLMTEPAQYLHNYGMLVSMELTTLAPFILDEVVIKLNRFRETAPTVVLACEFNLKCLRSLVHWRTILRHNGALSLLAVITKALNGDESHIQQMSRAESFDRLLRTLKTAPHNTSSRSTLSNQKTETLKSVLSEHFTRKGGNARVIVFVMLRETVSSVVVELNHMKGIHAHEFVGQANKTGAGGISKGLNQREQREVLSAFNSGAYNVLVATSIAEEGLDINDVDLIVLYDHSSSPVRLVQRIGRTGRKKSGKVIALVADDDERDKIEESFCVLKSVSAFLYDDNYTLFRHGSHRLPADSLLEMVETDAGLNLIQSATVGVPALEKRQREIIVVEEKPILQVAKNTLDTFFPTRPESSSSSLVERRPTARTYCSVCSAAVTTAGDLCAVCSSIIGESVETAKAFEAQAATPLMHQSEQRPPLVSSPILVQSVAIASPAIYRLLSTDYLELKSRLTKAPVDVLCKYVDSQLTAFSHLDVGILGASLAHVGSLTFKSCRTFPSTKESRPSFLLPPITRASMSPLSGKRDDNHVDENAINRSQSRLVSASQFLKLDDSDEESSVSTPQSQQFQSFHESQQPTYSSQFLPVPPKQLADRTNLSPPLRNEPLHRKACHNPFQPMIAPKSKRPLALYNGRISKPLMTTQPYNGQLPIAARSTISSLINGMRPNSKKTSCDLSPIVHSSSSPARDGDDDILCCACTSRISYDDNPIILCEGACKGASHIECYGLSTVPTNNFYCEGCLDCATDKTCVLCRVSGGLLRLSTCGSWTHPVCVLFTSELTVDETSMRANNLNKLDRERTNLVCLICRKQGAAVQCAFASCLCALHPHCALTSSFQMVVRMHEVRETVKYEIYCSKHKDNILFDGYTIISHTFDTLEEVAPKQNASKRRVMSSSFLVEDTPDNSIFVHKKRKR